MCLTLWFFFIGLSTGELLAGNPISTIASLKINDSKGVAKYKDSIVSIKGIVQSNYIEDDNNSSGNYSIYDSTGSIVISYLSPKNNQCLSK